MNARIGLSVCVVVAIVAFGGIRANADPIPASQWLESADGSAGTEAFA